MKFARLLKCIGTRGPIPWFSGDTIICTGVTADADKLHRYQHCFNTVSGNNGQRIRPHTLLCTELSIFTVLFNTNKTKIFTAVIRICGMLLQVLSMGFLKFTPTEIYCRKMVAILRQQPSDYKC